MFKNLCVAFAVLGVVFIGIKAAPVSALSADEIQSQITTLLAQIKELTNQLNILRQQQTQIPPTDISTSHRAWCDRLIRNLSVGTSGEDVQGVQEYLHDQGYYNGDTTGYFGPVTANAVSQWQSSQGLSSVGIVGPASRERIRRWCGGGGGGNDKFNASPTQGAAPLQVTFYSKISGFHQASDSYMIEYGDGATEAAASCYAPTDYCQSPGQNTHTYTADGTYTAVLRHTTNRCGDANPAPGTPRCMAPDFMEIIGSVQITVSSQTSSCRPINYTAPLCSDGTAPMAQHNESGCIIGYECPVANFTPSPSCKAWNDGCNSCSRTAPDAPGMCSMRACFAAGKGYCSVYFDNKNSCPTPPPIPPCPPGYNSQWSYDQNGCRSASQCIPSGNQPPVISGVSGPTTLSVNQTGTWSVNASDPENGNLSYDITWGDEYVPYALMSNAASAPAFVQTSTFTHSYSRSGTFTISVVVRDANGQSAKTSTTVRVGVEDTICDVYYDPVCGQPLYSCNYSTGMACTQSMPAPKTYNNRCAMNAAGATYLYGGECRGYPIMCTDAGVSYPEGTSRNCIGGTTTTTGSCIADASYVCRSGSWKIEGGMQVACAADAMQCSNGQWVGRTGQSCQFVCPN